MVYPYRIELSEEERAQLRGLVGSAEVNRYFAGVRSRAAIIAAPANCNHGQQG